MPWVSENDLNGKEPLSKRGQGRDKFFVAGDPKVKKEKVSVVQVDEYEYDTYYKSLVEAGKLHVLTHKNGDRVVGGPTNELMAINLIIKEQEENKGMKM